MSVNRRRKAPWHSPSECSFDQGFRIGKLHGYVKGMKAAVSMLFAIPTFPIQPVIEKAEKKLKEWRKTRP